MWLQCTCKQRVTGCCCRSELAYVATVHLQAPVHQPSPGRISTRSLSYNEPSRSRREFVLYPMGEALADS
eukprot:scaffold23384_cov60-Phaeocystis_antarctica.AAC.2